MPDKFVRAIFTLLAVFMLAGCAADNPPEKEQSDEDFSVVKVGLLHSRTGAMAYSELPLRDAEISSKTNGGIMQN